MPTTKPHLSSLALLVPLIAGVAGCSSKPSAPMLRDSAVYENSQEGFRFLVPDGWTQTASAILPPGGLDGENFLVRYRVRSPELGATLQILCMDASRVDDLTEYHAGPSFRVEQWAPIEEADQAEINGTPATRLTLQGDISGRAMTKRVVCFEKNNRIYSFVGLYWSSDDKAAQQIERAIDSTLWDD